MKVLAIIPARGGSKEIPRKNLLNIAKFPLTHWTVQAAKDAFEVTEIIVTSEDEEILQTYSPYAHPRPAELASDTAQLEPVIADVLSNRDMQDEDIVVLLQPTSPLRNGRHIDDALRFLWSTNSDSVVSVCESHHLLWEGGSDPVPMYSPAARPRRQDQNQYEENGAIYAFTMAHWRRTNLRFGGRVALFTMSPEDSVQVDTLLDVDRVESLLQTTRRLSIRPPSHAAGMWYTDADSWSDVFKSKH
jgi:CMP-N,N'-diacetyllegionaminic acid synthase